MKPIRLAILALSALALLTLTGCAGSYLASSGPSRKEVVSIDKQAIAVVNLTPAVAKHEKALAPCFCFGDDFRAKVPTYFISRGDTINIQIWEAPPATLFTSSSSGAPTGAGLSASGAGHVTIPDQMVDDEGKITVPYVGRISVIGKRADQIETEIQKALKRKANDPQVVVRIIQGASFSVTVVGEVERSMTLPLTPRGEHLLDAITATGGVKGPSGKIAIRVARGDKAQTVPLDAIIANPQQNITLQPGDVVTALFQSNAFVAMGAISKPGEVPFETTGISLSQALARAGGLIDSRADITGVFLFRAEDPSAGEKPTPVVYQVDLRNPVQMLAMRDFPVRNNDVLYVSNAPVTDVQKFMTAIGSVVYPILNYQNLWLN